MKVFKGNKMSSLLDLLLETDNNGLSDKISEQYGLDKNQTINALQALMPAFSQGLKRNVGSPQDFGAFMQALAEGNHSQYISNPAQAFTQNGIDEGNQILGPLFKSKALSSKIATQAAIKSGISVNTLKHMLPSLAPLILGSLTKNMRGGNSSQSNVQQYGATGGANPLGRILEELMKGGLNNRGSSGNNPLGDIIDQMMGRNGGFGAPKNRKTGQSSREDRLGDIFGQMLDGKSDGFKGPVFQENDYNAPYPDTDADTDPYADAPIPDNRSENQSAPQRRPRGGGLEDLFGDMFRPSNQENQKYGREVDSIFDEFLGPNSR